jgi:hypothetical protein
MEEKSNADKLDEIFKGTGAKKFSEDTAFLIVYPHGIGARPSLWQRVIGRLRRLTRRQELPPRFRD